jgi:HEAT repeat protein
VRKLLLAVVVAGVTLAPGCGRSRPTLAGGKPVGHWVRALKDPDPRVRKKAALKLGNVGPGDARALPALVGALKDPDARVRREAIRALLKFGPAAREALPALAEARSDPDPQARAEAAVVLEKLGGSR